MGKPGRSGVAAISIPVAFSLSRSTFVVGGSITGSSMSPSDFDRPKATDFSNGSAWAMAGFDGKWGRATLGIMFLSGTFDNVFNITYQIPVKGETAFAVGVQDLIGDGGASGDAIDAVRDESSRSFFGVATHPIQKGLYATAGLGTNRFRFGFAGLSWNASPDFTLTAEHDGFNFNGSAIWHPRAWKVGDRSVQPALQVGTIRGKYLHLALTFGF